MTNDWLDEDSRASGNFSVAFNEDYGRCSVSEDSRSLIRIMAGSRRASFSSKSSATSVLVNKSHKLLTFFEVPCTVA